MVDHKDSWGKDHTNVYVLLAMNVLVSTAKTAMSVVLKPHVLKITSVKILTDRSSVAVFLVMSLLTMRITASI